jgi:PAS domain S-box-containing protein
LENINLHKDGHLVLLETNGAPVFDKQGRFRGYRGMDRDVTARRQAEEALRESEERFRRVVEHIGDALFVDDVDGHIVFANDQFLNLFGFRREELLSIALEDYVAPEYRAELRGRHDRRLRGEVMPTQFEYEGIRRDGTRMWLQVDVVPIKDQTGKLVGTQSAVRDITDRKRAEDAMRESEERFRFVANTVPVMIWMSGPDMLCTYFNQPWLEFTGRPLEAELGNGWSEGVHAEDLKACMDIYSRAFDRHESFKMQYRLRRHDGEYRWVFDIGVPRLNPDGSFAGYIGSCIDITDRKLAEEALADMGRRLIEAHEEERAWIARELHDDINQRIALLAIELEQLKQDIPDSATASHEHIRQLRQRLSDIGKDIQALSHRLHSSKLEYLGIVAATGSFCKELSEQHNVEIEFTHSGITRSVPKEISLCLFRVLQEALQNAVKHSHVRYFKVHLQGTPEEIQLSVSDTGVGFDPIAAISGRGLGLISMQERVHLINGDLSIESQADRGTTIRVRARLKPEESFEEAAG